MSDEVYYKLAKILDSLPNGFPSTESGVEIKLLKRIFRPEDIDLFADLKLNFETAENIVERTGRPQEGLEDRLTDMAERGQIMKVEVDGVKLFRMMPWAFGIYEFQVDHMDREMAAMCEEFMKVYARAMFTQGGPRPMRVIPVEKEIPAEQQALPYEQVSKIIEESQSFLLLDCICKKEKILMDDGCDHPLEVCLGLSTVPGVFENYPSGRIVTREKAAAVLDQAEQAGMVHLTWNVKETPILICNCCGCCCGSLRAIAELNLQGVEVIHSTYLAEIDPDKCELCGVCKDERCQLNAIEEKDEVCRVIKDLCIGCGVCVSACPTEAIKLKRKPEEEIDEIPEDEMDWFDKRAQARGIDISMFKK